MTPEQQAAIQQAMERKAAAEGNGKRDAYVGGVMARNSQANGVPDHAEATRIAEQNMARAGISRGEAALHGFNQGTTYGFADELVSAVSPETGQAMRERTELAREAYPGLTGTSQVAGAVMSPANLAMPATTSVRGAAAIGGVAGAVAAAGDAEGSLAERADDAAGGAVTGVFFGGLGAAAWKGASNGVRKLFERAEKRPTIEVLSAVKNRAYEAVRRSGVEFSETEKIGLWSRLDDIAKDPRWDIDPGADVDKGALDALSTLRRRAEETGGISLNNLDKTRQKLWLIYKKSGHPFVLEAIGELDGMVAGKAAGNDVIRAAREANSRYAKAELLENAFRRARRQTAGSGSGGNILNKYKQAVTSILEKPHEAKWFSKEELAIMDQFVMGDDAQNVMRRIGKLAPGGNGLMTALNVYGAAVDPSLLAITAAGTAAKTAADRGGMRGSEALLDVVSTGNIPKPVRAPTLNVPAVGGAAAGNQLVR